MPKLIIAKLRLFFPKEGVTCVDDISSGLQDHLVPARNTLPAAARDLVNVSAFCHLRCSKEDRSKRCSLFYFLPGFLDGQSLSVLGITGGLVIYSPLLM